VLTYPSNDVQSDLSRNWKAHLIYNLRKCFKNRFVSLTALFEAGDVPSELATAAGAEGPVHTITFITNHADLSGNIHTTVRALWSAAERRALQEQINKELIALQESWVVYAQLVAGRQLTAHHIVYDPARKRIDIEPVGRPSTLIEDYEERLTTTRELLTFVAGVGGAGIAAIVSLPEFALDHYPLIKMYRALLTHRLTLSNVRVNVADPEEWDYVDPQLDAEFASAAKTTA